jgi:hypothetical protein
VSCNNTNLNTPPVRLRHLAKNIHLLGEQPLFELFRELEQGEDLYDALERYAALSYLAEFIALNDGDRFPQLEIVGDPR